EVLGAIESGVDFEKRIAAIYQNCRKPDEIATAFNQLQLELNLEINESMMRTRQQLLENFDDEVREKLKVRDEASRAYLNRYERLLMQLTRHELHGQAEFLGDAAFRLTANPFPQQAAAIPLGLYELPRRSGEAHLYRLNHPLAEALMANAKSRDLPPAEIHFDYGQHDGKVTTLEPLIGKTGWLALSFFSVEALDQAEDHLIFSAVTDDGQTLDDEVAQRLLMLPVTSPPLPQGEGWGEGGVQATLAALTQHRQTAIQRVISERNARFFEAEADKLDGWADDLKMGLEREIKEIDRLIKEARRAATTALTLEEKLAGQKQIKALEAQRNQKRRSLFDAQDQVDKQREELIAIIEGKLNQTTTMQPLFMLRWVLS
ncbi:MAG: DEAD/DEAH box helicase, partial [Sulfuritalea sp.]|nr:DEAD/DEAH box helicase [Sulfuritalea sp.]